MVPVSLGFGPLPLCGRFRCAARLGLVAKMPLHPKVNRQNHGDDGGGAEHQNRKQNLHHHRDSGYQNGTAQDLFSRAFPATITEMKSASFP